MNLKDNLHENIRKYICEEIFVEQIYSFHTSRKKPIILDCGANVGYSILYFKDKYPDAMIYAFEPHRQTCDLLFENIKKNHFTNVKIENKAVCDIDGTVDFYELKEDKFNIPVMSLFHNDFAKNKIQVKAVCFGNFIKQFDIIDFCKLDIEGGESLVLKSLIEQRSLSKINEFVIEYHHWTNQLYDFETFVKNFELNNFECIILKTEPVNDFFSTSGNTILRCINKH